MRIRYSDYPKGQRPARRRDAPVACASCGRTVERKSRRQTFCSARCRARAHYAKVIAQGDRPRNARTSVFLASEGGDTGLLTNPQKNTSKINGQQGPDSRWSIRIFGPSAIIEAEVFSRAWHEAISSDGVRYQISRVPRRALVDGGAR
jgi:hypothetical protein